MNSNDQSQGFIWPEMPEPWSYIVKFLAKYAIYIVLGILYLLNKLGITSSIPSLIVFNIFLLGMGWLFLKQQLTLLKILGWIVIMFAILITLLSALSIIFPLWLW
ncbi:hypothetical protein M1563_01530 [Patescibacteria group bacterium]|nr:hypothetical protein [Patescibacteria group bacterium]